MTPEELARNDRIGLVSVLVAVFFLLWSFYISAEKDIPTLGFMGYLTGPMFTHKLSEILLIIMWSPIVWVSNYERVHLWPKRMQPRQYLRLLKTLLFLAPFQVFLATYAWTIVNLGTSPLTTNYDPLVFREDGWVWMYYLAAVIVAGMAFIWYASRKAMSLASRLAKETPVSE